MGLFDKLKRKVEGGSEKEANVLVEKKAIKNDTKEIKPEKKDSKKLKEGSIIDKKTEDKSAKKDKKVARSNAHSVLKKSFVSEKAAGAEANGVYTFVVDLKANKFSVKESVKAVYGIMPKKVRIINMEGKRMNSGRRRGKKSDWKKAIVTLPKGKVINIHEGV